MQAWIPVVSSSLYFWKSVFSFRTDNILKSHGDFISNWKSPDYVHFFGEWARQALIIAVVYKLMKRTQEELFDWLSLGLRGWALFSFCTALSLTLSTTSERHGGVRSRSGIFLLDFFKTLLNLRKSTAEERRRQTLCDKRNNNFHQTSPSFNSKQVIPLSRLSQRSAWSSTSFCFRVA